jgi:glutamyl-tRNA reductase
MHTIDDLKKMTYKNAERRHGIFNAVNRNSAILIDETWKISFSISIVEYNTHMRGSDENAQQRAYYSSHNRLDSRY